MLDPDTFTIFAVVAIVVSLLFMIVGAIVVYPHLAKSNRVLDQSSEQMGRSGQLDATIARQEEVAAERYARSVEHMERVEALLAEVRDSLQDRSGEA